MAAGRMAIMGLLLLSAFVPTVEASRRKATVKHDALTAPVLIYEDSGHDFSVTLSHLAQQYQIPIGLDLEPPLSPNLISVHISGGIVVDVLNAILAQEPSYKWVDVDGVVNVMPKQNAASILDLRIPHFRVKNASFFDVHNAIVSLPEVAGWLKRNRLTEDTPMVIDVFVGKDFDWPRISLNLHNASIREILNEIVSRPGFGSWSVGRWGQQNQYFMISVVSD